MLGGWNRWDGSIHKIKPSLIGVQKEWQDTGP